MLFVCVTCKVCIVPQMEMIQCFKSKRNRRKAELSESPFNVVLKSVLHLILLFDLDLDQYFYTGKNKKNRK